MSKVDEIDVKNLTSFTRQIGSWRVNCRTIGIANDITAVIGVKLHDVIYASIAKPYWRVFFIYLNIIRIFLEIFKNFFKVRKSLRRDL